MEGKIIQIMGPVVDVEFDGYLPAINDAIELGLRCVTFEIDHYICWGTPNDLRTFEYWQTCFDGWKSHPYQKKKDRNIFNIM